MILLLCIRRFAWLALAILGCGLSACERCNKPVTPPVQKDEITVNPPPFNSDTAYHYIAAQLSFGTRHMNSKGHEACARFLIREAKRFADTVYVQPFEVTAHDGVKLRGTNIIASFNPQAANRVLLCSHWDSRPWADMDDSASTSPIPAANDGASGVGVLLEIARTLRAAGISIGVDIFFIDAEDYGKSGVDDSYCLGSQYWVRNPHLPAYKADFGILLDMVGAPQATFAREGYSMMYAQWVVDKVWSNAARLGYSHIFIPQTIGPITDDHRYINEIAHIPTIDIIQFDPKSPSGTFGSYWHTHDDNLNAIDKTTLQAVGKVVLYTLYRYEAEITKLK
ncbi:MAG: M28 family peptidase [Chitinophagales bacterium]|nr:M28 family peptidase [Chitinophagales bacterium]MDW8419088.1 M28 family peptidase [Chitinophagales bacterium]